MDLNTFLSGNLLDINSEWGLIGFKFNESGKLLKYINYIC